MFTSVPSSGENRQRLFAEDRPSACVPDSSGLLSPARSSGRAVTGDLGGRGEHFSTWCSFLERHGNILNVILSARASYSMRPFYRQTNLSVEPPGKLSDEALLRMLEGHVGSPISHTGLF